MILVQNLCMFTFLQENMFKYSVYNFYTFKMLKQHKNNDAIGFFSPFNLKIFFKIIITTLEGNVIK